MSQFDFVIKQGDTKPSFIQNLTDSTGAAINLTGSSVKLVVRALTGTDPLINASATILNAVTGQVGYSFSTTDSANAGTFMANWIITDSISAKYSVPTDGYISISIEQNLVADGGAQIVSLAEVKDYLNIPSTDRTRDSKLLRMANDLIPVVEHITGPVIQRIVEEWHSGGQFAISLRQRPVHTVIAVSEFRGPIEWPLSIVPDPAHGSIYSVMLESTSRLIRRGPGGTVMAFPPGPSAVKAVYLAGRETVPSNIRLGLLELIRINFGQTQARPLLRGWPTDGTQDEQLPGSNIFGFFVPNRVRELLNPSQQAPGIF